MKDIIERKIKEIEIQLNDYIDMLDERSYFTTDYIIERIKECKAELGILKEVLLEYEER